MSGRRRQPPKFRARFVTVDAATAADGLKKVSERSTPTVAAASRASDLQLNKLWLSTDQRAAIDACYHADDRVIDRSFDPGSDDDQTHARALLGAHGLDVASRELYSNRWYTAYSKATVAGKDKRVLLLQCNCSYNHEARGSKVRKSPLPFTGCLAHAEIVYHADSNLVLRVRGILERNDSCTGAEICGLPRMPVHPEVYAAALRQLALGATYHEIMERNRALFLTPGGYASQPKDLSASKYRWELQLGDSRSLYRQHHQLAGISVREQAHINIHQWLDPTSPKYDAELAKQVFHYQARSDAGERFEVCISTDRMKAAAWKYSHHSQLLLDGTFGVCNRKILVFILLGLDEENHGVPLAVLMFSAPSGNRQTSAGYDADVLKRLITAWKDSLGRSDGQSFEPYVVITDTDVRERNALLAVWPRVWLLLCKFHLRQSWRNHRNKELKGKSPALIRCKERLRRVEENLVDTVSYDEACGIIAHERLALGDVRASAPSAYAKAIAHLDYLADYWLPEALWKSWAQYGRVHAANLLGCPVDGVLTTTNHLEAFNRVLKRKHLRRWQRNGRPLRIDVLVRVLCTRILPAIFVQRDFDAQSRFRAEQKVLALPGGTALLAARRAARIANAPVHVAFLAPDESRDAGARKILQYGQISSPQIDDRLHQFAFSCYSSLALAGEHSPQQYQILLYTTGLASCTCLDWQQRGGACKHIRAALLKLDSLRC